MIAASRAWIVFVYASLTFCHGDLNTSEDPCKNRLNSLEICLKNVSVLLDHTGLNGIPKSKNEVDVVCKGFKSGMKCVDEFSNLCLSIDQKNLVYDNVIGAKYTFKFLCDDELFQKDYLKYTDCYRAINSDWDTCTSKFMSLVREEMNANRSEDAKVFDLCCAKQGFLNCVYTTSKIKCGIEEANFIKRIAATLSENKLVSTACQQIKLTHCNTAQQIAHSMFMIILNVFIAIWRYKM